MSAMKKFFVVLILAAAAGAYFYNSRGDGRDEIGAPVLSASASPTASASVMAFTDGTYLLVAASSSMEWDGRKTLIVNYIDRGTVKLSAGQAVVRDGAPVSGSVTVDMTSISTTSTGRGSGESMQEKHMKSADFFDVAKYPTASFAFESLIPASAGYTVAGMLTVKGIEQPIRFPATISAAGDTLTMKATAILDRTLWGIKYGSGKFFEDLGDKVIDDLFTVSFTAVARLQ
jgi:polyisoprenoid-binding protein YceI